jgi:alanine dehydrogenase
MKIGVPRETKDNEYRVGMTPDGARQLVADGHRVLVERGAGLGSGFADEDYARAGATLAGVEETWGEAELIVKVKEPNPAESARLRAGQTLFAYLHLAPNRALTESLLGSGVRAIAYETMQHADGTFPVLAPMSEVAGRLAIQIGVSLLQKDRGGRGLLVGGVPGVPRGIVTIVGAGIVGINAVRVAHALGAEVTVLDVDLRRLTYLYDLFHGELSTLYSNRTNLERTVAESDLLVGAVYLRGRRAPRLVSEKMVASMQAGAVVVDVAVDQGGCIETIRPTTHSDPIYLAHDVIHYGVANMPAAVPRTSTFALTNVTLPYVERMAERGVEAALRAEPELALGANVWCGALVEEGVAEAHGLPSRPLAELLGR